MTKLWIHDSSRESVVDLLVPLKVILSRLPLTHINAWSVRNLEAQGVMPFGIPMTAFESLTDQLTHGVLLTPVEFAVFATDEVQILEGEFVAFSFQRGRRDFSGFKGLEAFTLRCLDSSVWECETDDDEIVSAIRRGFRDVQEPPR